MIVISRTSEKDLPGQREGSSMQKNVFRVTEGLESRPLSSLWLSRRGNMSTATASNAVAEGSWSRLLDDDTGARHSSAIYA